MRGNATFQRVGPPGFRGIPLLTRGLLAALVAGYVVTAFLNAAAWLVVSPSLVLAKVQLWRLLTYPFAIGSILSLLFVLLMAWQFSTELEVEWGRPSYAAFLLLAVLVPSVLAIPVSLLLGLLGPMSEPAFAGSSGFVTTLICAWAFMAPRQEIFFWGVIPMKRQVFAWVAVIISAVLPFEAAGGQFRTAFVVALWALGGVPVAWYWVRGRRARPLQFRLPNALRKLQRRRHLRVVRNDDKYIH